MEPVTIIFVYCRSLYIFHIRIITIYLHYVNGMVKTKENTTHICWPFIYLFIDKYNINFNEYIKFFG